MNRYCYNCMQPIEDYSGVCPHCGQAPFGVNPVHQLKTGTLLKDRYLVGKSLGQGGFGITYIGLDTTLDVRVAVKEYYPNGISNRNHEVTDDVTQTSSDTDLYNKGKFRFLQEAKTLARFSEEPGVVSVRDFFEANNTAYIVMEYLDGVTLKRFVESRGKIPSNALFRAMRPIMRSLVKVHAQGVIHRDISPDNIMVLRDGSLKLLDFGAAREVGGDKSLSVMLKPGYAPEEQYRSKGRQGPWTDIYALSATMYYCLTGIKPEESVERMVEDTLRRPSELGADITQAQESVILRGLAVHAKDRYQSMQELADALYSTNPLNKQSAAKIKHAQREKEAEPPKPAVLAPEPEKSRRQATRQPQDPKENAKQDEKIPPKTSSGKKSKRKRRWLWVLGIFITAIVAAFNGVMLYASQDKTDPVIRTEEIQPTATPQPITTPESTGAPQSTPEPVDGDALHNQGKQYRDAEALASLPQSNSAAMYQQGLAYENGDGVEQNYSRALDFYEQAADAGSDAAMNKIGDFYYKGSGVAQDSRQAKSWYSKAADCGNAPAMFNLGYLYETECDAGNYIGWDYRVALDWYQKAADFGVTEAMLRLGLLYKEGKSIVSSFERPYLILEQNYEKALEWLQKAAENGSSEAMREIGYMYFHGQGVKTDYVTAADWYQKAAKAGDADAMFFLGELYQFGQGVEANQDTAQEWYRKASEAGNEDAKAKLAQ